MPALRIMYERGNFIVQDVSAPRTDEDVFVPHCGWLRFAPGDNIASFLREGWCDHVELAFLWRLLRPGDCFLDCGSHAGLYSLLALRATDPGGRAIAVEPNPRVLAYLEANLAGDSALGRVKLHRAAVGAAPGRARFVVGEEDRTAFDHLLPAGDASLHSSVEVEVSTIDALLEAESGLPVACAKLDVEGAEVAAISGATAAPSKARCWLIEFTEVNLRRFGAGTSRLFRAVEDSGMRLYRWDKDTGLIEAKEQGPIWYENLIATADPDWICERLQSASPDRLRISTEILARGQASEELHSGALHMSRDRAVRNVQASRDEAHEAQRRALEAEARTQHTLEQLDEAYRRLGEANWNIDQLAKRNAAANGRAHEAEIKMAEACLRRAGGAAFRPPHTQHALPGKDTPGAGVAVSVVICTFNPAPAILDWALASLDRQTFPHSRFEVLIVDNGSATPVAGLEILKDRSFPLRVVEEPRNGVLNARCKGIQESAADLILFLDDDNYLDPDYILNAIAIAGANPHLGAFGGKARLLCDRSLEEWQKPLMIYFGVRDYGDDVITSVENKWGEWEPIGAGMVFRRALGEAFLATVAKDRFARRIGRTKDSYICGEDSLLARLGYGLGYACSYQPSLVLTHFIRESRLTPKIMARTIAGVGRSHVLYELVLGTSSFRKPRAAHMLLDLYLRGRHRVRTRGLKAGVLEWFWDVGYYRQIRECLS
jgi:FkbM family methyltransferase